MRNCPQFIERIHRPKYLMFCIKLKEIPVQMREQVERSAMHWTNTFGKLMKTTVMN